MTTDSYFAELFAKKASLIKPGLQRMEKAYAWRGKPSHHTPCVLVAGTNGKGSTAAFLWSMLVAAGQGAGLYSSPHLVDFAERMLVPGGLVTDAAILAKWRELAAELPTDIYEPMSFFEVTTLIAFELFQAAGTQVNVWEVGLGGRWDATNVSDPFCAVITGIGRDHQKILGESLYEIAGEKLGVVRAGRPVFLGSGGELFMAPEAQQRVVEHCAALGSPLWRLGHEFFDEHTGYFCLNLPGLPAVRVAFPPALLTAPPFLRANFTLAAAVYWYACHQLSSGQASPLPWQALWEKWVKLTAPPCLQGRFQRLYLPMVGRSQAFLFDVCHNRDGVRAFDEALTQAWQRAGVTPRPLPGLVSILRDKDINEMLDVLKGILQPLVLFRIDHERTLSRDDLAERHHDLPLCASFDEACAFLRGELADDALPWVMCGSVLALGQVFKQKEVPVRQASLRRVLDGDWDFVAMARSLVSASDTSGRPH